MARFDAKTETPDFVKTVVVHEKQPVNKYLIIAIGVLIVSNVLTWVLK